MSGWIKLHRKIRNNPYMKKPAYRAVWTELLLEASFSNEKSIIWKGDRIDLKQGQLTCGMKQLSEWTGVSRGTVERIIKRFKSEEQIEVQTSNKFSLITIKNWDLYQGSEEQNEEQMRNKRGTNEEQMRTPKERKKERKKEKYILDSVDDKFLDIVQDWIEYKKQIKNDYKTQRGFDTFYKKLLNMSGNNKEIAKTIIQQSINNEWKGIFEVKGELPKITKELAKGWNKKQFEQECNKRGFYGEKAEAYMMLYGNQELKDNF